MNTLWTTLSARANLTLTEDQHALLNKFLDLLIEANQTMNLTRITDREQAENLHIGDALSLLQYIPAGEIAVADIGSGGGVPGIPLAIARPDARVLLVESTKKKAAYLRQTVEALGLTNVRVSDERVEDVGHSGRRGSFDVVTARAVASLAWLVEWSMPLLRKGGVLLAQKGMRVIGELEECRRARKALHAGEPKVELANLGVPGADGFVIVVIPREGPTKDAYPRLPNVAKGNPL
jgi:16S rRNA (guanine527-N7)-methyltransferase